MKHTLTLTTVLLFCCMTAAAQNAPENSDDRMACYRTEQNVRRIVSIPDIPGYNTLKCDFHLHTTYADAEVSPAGRVMEAWYDGLDVIAMTEHIGVEKNRSIHIDDLNIPYELAAEAGRKYGMLVIHGAEITRAKPFGHMNALFIEDSNAFSTERYVLDKDGKPIYDPVTGYRLNNEETLKSDFAAAERQGAFILWNHPGWPDKKCDMFPLQEGLIKEGRIHAVEICNHLEWYPKVLDWFDQYHLPMMANSDQHRPSSMEFGRSLRPMTLVFAREYSESSLKEAMFAGRMLALWDNTLAGDEALLTELVHSCLKVKVIDAKKGTIEVSNISDIRFETMYGSHMNPVVLYPHGAIIMTVKKGQKIEFLNCYKGRKTLHTNLW